MQENKAYSVDFANCLAHYIQYHQFKKKLEKMDKYSGLAYFERARSNYAKQAKEHFDAYTLQRTVLENRFGPLFVDRVIQSSWDDWEAQDFLERAEEFTRDYMCDSLGCSGCALFNFDSLDWCKKFKTMPQQLFERCGEHVPVKD